MSVKTAAQSFEHKPISNNLAPKPYGNSSLSKKPKTLEKPSFLTNNNNSKSIDRESLPTKKPAIQTNELSSFKFKNDKTINNNKETGSLQNGITNTATTTKTTANTNTNSTTKKKPPSVSKKPAPPTDEELTVRHVEEKSADQLKNEIELKKLPSGSVRNSKMMFEKHGVDAGQVRRRTSMGASSKKSRAGNAISNSSTDSSTSNETTSSYNIQTTNISPKMSTFNVGSKQQQHRQHQQQNNKNKSRKLPSTPATPTISAPEIIIIEIDYDQLEQNYDVVKTTTTLSGPSPIAFPNPIAPPVMRTKPIQPIVRKPDARSDDIYDDVQQHTPLSVAQADETYDDVSSSKLTQPTPNNNSQIPPHSTNNIVNPANFRNRPNNAQLPPPPAKQCLYDDVQGVSADVSNVEVAGEELYDDVSAAGSTPIGQDIYDDVQTPPVVPPSSVPQHIQSRPPLSPKEKKRKETEKKKAEKEKEKERNRKNKELKSFGVSYFVQELISGFTSFLLAQVKGGSRHKN